MSCPAARRHQRPVILTGGYPGEQSSAVFVVRGAEDNDLDDPQNTEHIYFVLRRPTIVLISAAKCSNHFFFSASSRTLLYIIISVWVSF